MTRRDKRLTLEQSKRINNVRVLGGATALPIVLDDGELVKLFAVIASDVGRADLSAKLPKLPEDSEGDYYKIPTQWFTATTGVHDCVGLYLLCENEIEDFSTYLECISGLHKRRRKYEKVLSAQPVPTMLQVAPRALLEFGGKADRALASWIVWRKWFYDIDNRAAQETGYLFEPVLANALGGIRLGASGSPVKRRSDRTKGRQVDCLVGKDAYEFKLRVTIAASGQGRFGEELDFAGDCRESGFNPILLVLDPTPSARLDDLTVEFKKCGGTAFVGDAAWSHLESEAGPTMAKFLERYIRTPIASIDSHSSELLDLNISATNDRSKFSLKIGTGDRAFEWTIPRAENDALAVDGDGDSAS
ncbi:MAG TPA: hypothetical protein PKD49_06300 [Hyphomicrobium sp.]|nr:hypothetical protein [Hyphomicrobium sp.]